MNETLHTKWGAAKIDSKGYYRITSIKEGNRDKLLHRLIWEDFYGCEIPKGYIIHHKNGNKLDNCILNLQLMSRADHNTLHKTGETHTEESKRKMSESHKGEKNSMYGRTGENCPGWKNYPRITKKGFCNNKQKYAIRYEGKILKQSVYLHKLYKWWGKNHPDEFLYLEI